MEALKEFFDKHLENENIDSVELAVELAVESKQFKELSTAKIIDVFLNMTQTGINYYKLLGRRELTKKEYIIAQKINQFDPAGYKWDNDKQLYINLNFTKMSKNDKSTDKVADKKVATKKEKVVKKIVPQDWKIQYKKLKDFPGFKINKTGMVIEITTNIPVSQIDRNTVKINDVKIDLNKTVKQLFKIDKRMTGADLIRECKDVNRNTFDIYTFCKVSGIQSWRVDRTIIYDLKKEAKAKIAKK